MVKTKLVILDVKAFFKRKVTRFGNGAKIDCLKEHIGKNVLVVIEDET